RQSKLLNKVLPAMAKRSTKPIIFIDVTAIKNNEQNLPETVHLGSLLGELEDNELGPNDTAIELKDNGYLLPYGYVAVNGKKTYDFSYSVYSETVEDKKIQVAIVSHLLGVISESNKKTGSENNSSQ
ncbi:MAG: hypothetical protein KDE33_20735, partial [Bacteroidetes bacterium]|nr:hypothetical protein [Bacteroidota bacterium]